MCHCEIVEFLGILLENEYSVVDNLLMTFHQITILWHTHSYIYYPSLFDLCLYQPCFFEKIECVEREISGLNYKLCVRDIYCPLRRNFHVMLHYFVFVPQIVQRFLIYYAHYFVCV